MLVFLDRSFESTTYGLQSSVLGPPSIIFHKSPMNLLKALVVALLTFACDLESVTQSSSRVFGLLSNEERGCYPAFLDIHCSMELIT